LAELAAAKAEVGAIAVASITVAAIPKTFLLLLNTT